MCIQRKNSRSIFLALQCSSFADDFQEAILGFGESRRVHEFLGLVGLLPHHGRNSNFVIIKLKLKKRLHSV